MRTIIRRKDRSSIFIPPSRRHASTNTKTKIMQLLVACTLMISGVFVLLLTK